MGQRGVFEVGIEFQGVKTFHLITAHSDKCMEVRIPADRDGPSLRAFLHDYLDEIDPPLKLVRDDAS